MFDENGNVPLCNKKAFCPFNYKNCDSYDCYRIIDLLGQIKPMDTIKCFRVLSEKEKKIIDFNCDEDNSRGSFDEINIDECNVYEAIDKIFNYVRITLNNKNSVDKLYSYSKSLFISLFKYTTKDTEPAIVIKNLPINSIDIAFTCTYNQWIKGYYSEEYDGWLYINDDNYVTYGINEIFREISSLDNIRRNMPNNFKELYTYLKGQSYDDYYKKHQCYPFSFYILSLEDKMITEKYNQLEFADLDYVSDLKIDGFTLDMTNFNREILNEYLEEDSKEQKRVKNFANYTIDREIITTRKPCSYSMNKHILKGNKLIKCMRGIGVCVVYIEKYKDKIEDKYYNVINDFINEKIDENKIVNLLTVHLRNNYEQESESLYDLLNKRGIIYQAYSNLEINKKLLVEINGIDDISDIVLRLLVVLKDLKNQDCIEELFFDEFIYRIGKTKS